MVLEGLSSWNREHQTDGRTDEEKQGDKSEKEGRRERKVAGSVEGGGNRRGQGMKREMRRKGS